MKFFTPFLFLFLPFLAFSETLTMPRQDLALIEALHKNHIKIILIRHGEAIHNLQHLMNSSDSPGIYLTDKGISQIKEAASKLTHEHITTIFVSPIYRTLQSAQLIGTTLKLPYQKYKVDDRLREQYFGSFEDKTYEDYVSYFPFPEDAFIKAVPGGESGVEVFKRVEDVLWEIAEQHPKETVLIVTHAYVAMQTNKALLDNYDFIPEQGKFKIYDFTGKMPPQRLFEP